MRYILKNLEIIDTLHRDGKVPFLTSWKAAAMSSLITADAHRAAYTRDDAQSVVDWLNSRPTAEQLTHQGILHALLREQAVPWRVYKLSRPGIPVAEHQFDYNARDWEVLADLRWRDHTT